MTAPAKTGAPVADYFSLFGLPRKLWIEMSGLEQKFLQLSWKLHPDNFVKASDDERELSLKRSSELNDALDELREAKAAGLALDGMKERLHAAEKKFGAKLAEVDAEMQATAKDW